MRNHKSFKPQQKAEAPEVRRAGFDTNSLADEVKALRVTIEAAASREPPQISDASELRRLAERIEAAMARPRTMAVEVIRDDDGEITGMVGTTDPDAIKRVRGHGNPDEMADVDEWMRQLSIRN